MKILFLYAEVTGYLMGCLRALREHPQVDEIRVYQALKLPETDFRLPPEEGIQMRSAIGRSGTELWAEMESFRPQLVFVSGWMFRKYHFLARKLRAQGAVLVVGNDTPWYGTFRQRIGAASSPFWLSSLYHYMWVPGDLQYTFARRLGFPPHRIQTGLLSADVEAFRQVEKPRNKTIKTLLSAGSFLPNKGMARLYAAFSQLLQEGLTGWELHLVGSGPQTQILPSASHIRITPFVQPEAMPQVFAEADAFALASLKESWSVAVHEAACAGLPLLLSQSVGAADDFLEEDKNGFLFDPRSSEDLIRQMRQLLALPDEELRRMGERSAVLSQRYSPQLWAEKLVGMALAGHPKKT